jgi:transposase
MFRRGKSQAEVAHALGVSRESASRWYQAWREGGKQALAGAGRAGRLPRLSDDQLELVLEQLVKGPEANGYENGLWTLSRVAEVIETVTGVTYSTSQTWEILRKRLNWSRQRPARRALERDDQAIVNWAKNDWPRIKKAEGSAHGAATPEGQHWSKAVGVGPDTHPWCSQRLEPGEVRAVRPR